MMLPVQYACGKAYFMDFEFGVGPGVFIPRPETEILVEKVCDQARNFILSHNMTINILDVCTGSGNIAISLTKYIKQSKILGLDVSPAAIKQAGMNAALNAAERVSFIQSDLYSALKPVKAFDMIVSNPPYINAQDMLTLPDDVKEEPELALSGGVDGLDVYRALISQAPLFLKDRGYIFFEIGYDQARGVSELLENNGFGNIEVFKDYSGIDRIIKAQNG